MHFTSPPVCPISLKFYIGFLSILIRFGSINKLSSAGHNSRLRIVSDKLSLRTKPGFVHIIYQCGTGLLGLASFSLGILLFSTDMIDIDA
jgi:hypothetical protein